MNKKIRLDSSAVIPLLLIAALAAAVILIAVVPGVPRFSEAALRYARPASGFGGWSVGSDGAGKKVSIPGKIELTDGEACISALLPENSGSGSALCFATKYCAVRVFAGGEEIYSYGISGDGKIAGVLASLWNIVSLPENCAGSRVEIRLYADSGTDAAAISGMTLGSRGETVTSLVRGGSGIIFFTLLMLVLALFCIAVAVAIRLLRLALNYKSFLYLGLFAFLAMSWTFSDSRMPQFVIGSQLMWYYISFFSFMLMVIPMLLFVREICTHGKKLLNALSVSFLLCFAVQTVLHFTSVAEFLQTLFVTHALIIISAAVIACLIWIEAFRYKNRNTVLFIIGMSILLSSAAVSVVLYYFGPVADNSLFFRHGIMAFILFLCIGSVTRGIVMLRENIEAGTYRKLAYTDGLTSLANRLAFNERLDEIAAAPEKYRSVGMIMLDINDFKGVNDRYGHLEGDAMLVGVAGCMKDTLEKIGLCCRIGGDEFVTVAVNTDAAALESAVREFAAAVDRYNENREILLAMSYGCAVTEMKPDTDLYGLLGEADRNMYGMKR